MIDLAMQCRCRIIEKIQGAEIKEKGEFNPVHQFGLVSLIHTLKTCESTHSRQIESLSLSFVGTIAYHDPKVKANQVRGGYRSTSGHTGEICGPSDYLEEHRKRKQKKEKEMEARYQGEGRKYMEVNMADQ